MTTFPIKGFTDNFFWAIKDNHNHVIIVDPGDAAPVIHTLRQQSLILDAILVTHHHYDHIGGINELLQLYSVPVYGPASNNIPMVTHALKEGDTVEVFKHSALRLNVLETPGHTLDDIAYETVINNENSLFCGDTLFGAGCGRILGGSYEQLYQSLQKINRLEDSTKIYCAHEFTLGNLTFASTVEPDNDLIKKRIEIETDKIRKGQTTVPFTLEQERQTNPFLRLHSPTTRQQINRYWQQQCDTEETLFTGLRRWKDSY